MLGLLGAVSLSQGFFLGLTDLCCGEVEAQCRANCNSQVRYLMEATWAQLGGKYKVACLGYFKG